MFDLGKILVVVGIVTVAMGLWFMVGKRLPGDILIQKDNVVFFFPIVTSIVLSVILTILFNLFRR